MAVDVKGGDMDVNVVALPLHALVSYASLPLNVKFFFGKKSI